MIVPFPPGGQIDIIARLVGQWLSERLGQQFFVDNHPGAGANIGTEAALRAPGDGYTLLLATTTNAINATLFDKLNFDFIRDSAAIASINHIPVILQTNTSFPAKSVAELIAYARSNPTKLNVATPPKGTGPYMAAELFKMMAGIDFVTVAYRGDAPAITDLLGGQVQAGFNGISPSIEQIRAGKLRAIAFATAQRVAALPNVATIGETIRGYEATGWCGIVSPKNTPDPIIERLNGEINAGLADPKISARFIDLIAPVFTGSPMDFSKFITAETEKWAKVIRTANIKPE
jgi:tripartite-type tricarboxylate transporter receptor subunit TctC